MGPAKGSRTIAKITVKGYDDRQHDEDPTSSSKVKLKKRKMSDLGPQWSKVELMRFYEAYHQHGKNWKKVSATVGGKSADAVKALYNENKTFLSLPEREGTAMGFVALVTGHHNVLEELPSPKESDQTVRASGKIRKRGEALQQKENEAPHPHHSYQQRRTSGFSSSFKKKYYGDLVKSIRRHPSGIRTPRVPVIVSADMHATDDAAPEMKYAANSSEKDNKQINNDRTIFAMDGCSPDGSSGIKKSTKVFQGQTFLETKGIGDTNISPTQQRLKKRRIDQSMNQGRTSKDELETTMVAKEGNKLPDCQGLTELFSPDEILVLDVLESLVTVPSKVLQPKINIPLDTLGNNDSALSDKMEEGLSVVQSKQGKRPGECIASKTRKKRSKNLLAEEVPAGEPNISGNNLVMQEECQVDATNCQSLNSEPERGPIDLPESTSNMCTETPDVPTQIKPEINMSRRSKRKSESRCERKYVSCPEGASNLQARRLLHCLSSESLRRWCTYEWFYSAVDYPWFMNNEFVNYLNFAKLSHLSRLTRSEWSTIRSSLGKPRRFSDNFLKVEKEKVEDYRKNVRQYYAQLSDGLRDSLPADLARPFSVGQQVIVRHPSTRELCDGEVLMIKQDCYKIQFDRPDLGDDIVKDIDCMPVNLSDNLPDDLKKRSSLSNDALNRLQIEHTPKLTPKENWDHMMNGFSISKSSKTLHITSDELLQVSAVDSERLPNNSTSGRYTPLPSLQCADNSVQSRGCSNNSNGHNDELDSFITSFVQRTESETKLVVDGAMQATNCANLESELPCKLIFNCIGTVLSIKQLSESRHPPASIAGVLERASSMLRPSCSENLSIYNDIESCISIIKNQILALVPATSMLPM